MSTMTRLAYIHVRMTLPRDLLKRPAILCCCVQGDCLQELRSKIENLAEDGSMCQYLLRRSPFLSAGFEKVHTYSVVLSKGAGLVNAAMIQAIRFLIGALFESLLRAMPSVGWHRKRNDYHFILDNVQEKQNIIVSFNRKCSKHYQTCAF